MHKLTEIAWPEFEALPLEAKKPYLENYEIPATPYHTLFAQQFDKPLLERLAALANRIRFMAKSKEGALYLKSLLPHKRAMLYFSQPSSRTFLSHLAACQILGLTTGSVRDSATSSALAERILSLLTVTASAMALRAAFFTSVPSAAILRAASLASFTSDADVAISRQ